MTGNKDQSFLTAKEKWLIGIFIATAVTATVTFVVNLVLILQLKDSINTGETAAFRKDFQNRTANLENQMRQSKTETEDLRQEYQSNMTQLQLKNQKEVEDLRQEFQSKMTELDDTIVKTNILYLEKLDKEGWKKFSNGLRYKRFDEAVTYVVASEKCKLQRARLASTGIRDAPIRSEIWSKISQGWNWIGLTQRYENNTWVWSDGQLFEDNDIPWDWTTCMTRTERHVKIKYQNLRMYMSCSGNRDVIGYICEI